jgi:hypothetical protein
MLSMSRRNSSVRLLGSPADSFSIRQNISERWSETSSHRVEDEDVWDRQKAINSAT